MNNSKKMKKDEWIAKFLEDLEMENEENFEEFIIRNYQIEYEDANTKEKRVLVPEIEIDDDGIGLTYELEHDNGEYTENGQRVYDSLELMVLKYNYTFSPRWGSIGNHITNKYVYLGIFWDKLENIIRIEEMQ